MAFWSCEGRLEVAQVTVWVDPTAQESPALGEVISGFQTMSSLGWMGAAETSADEATRTMERMEVKDGIIIFDCYKSEDLLVWGGLIR